MSWPMDSRVVRDHVEEAAHHEQHHHHGHDDHGGGISPPWIKTSDMPAPLKLIGGFFNAINIVVCVLAMIGCLIFGGLTIALTIYTMIVIAGG